MTRILGFETHDVRFPTSRMLDDEISKELTGESAAEFFKVRLFLFLFGDLKFC